MKNVIYILIFCTFSLLFAQDDAPAAVTLKMKGKIDVKGKDSKNLKNGDILYNKDKLTSGKNSFAALRFVDGSSIVKLFPNSELIINTENKNGKMQKKNVLTKGKLLSKIQKKMGGYQVETPTVVASVKGTEFLIIVDEMGRTTVYTFSGIVEMKNKQDGRSVMLGPDETGTSTGAGDIETGTFDPDKIPEKDDNELGDNEVETLQIEMEDADGTTKDVIIEVE